MMKKFLIFLIIGMALCTCFFIKTKNAVSGDALRDDQIYVFVQKGCPHCIAAENYLAGKYPSLDVQIRDIAKPNNRELFFACGNKFNIRKLQMGTPLFCIGSHYILGWTDESKQKLDTYIKEFLDK